jgi:DNA-binding response OmpR family regulator
VLVVDPLDETHEVLRAALVEQRVDVVVASNLAHGLALARRCLPSLIVLDIESDGSSSIMAGRLVAESAARCTPLLVLGAPKRDRAGLAGCEFFAKPYHYAPLIRKIEELLGNAVDAARRCDAKAA